jgi:hypothetical protein
MAAEIQPKYYFVLQIKCPLISDIPNPNLQFVACVETARYEI